MSVTVTSLEAIERAIAHLRTYGERVGADAVQALHDAFFNDEAAHAKLTTPQIPDAAELETRGDGAGDGAGDPSAEGGGDGAESVSDTGEPHV